MPTQLHVIPQVLFIEHLVCTCSPPCSNLHGILFFIGGLSGIAPLSAAKIHSDRGWHFIPTVVFTTNLKVVNDWAPDGSNVGVGVVNSSSRWLGDVNSSSRWVGVVNISSSLVGVVNSSRWVGDVNDGSRWAGVVNNKSKWAGAGNNIRSQVPVVNSNSTWAGLVKSESSLVDCSCCTLFSHAPLRRNKHDRALFKMSLVILMIKLTQDYWGS